MRRHARPRPPKSASSPPEKRAFRPPPTRGDADTLDALGGQLRDVLDEDLRGTLTDMYERLRAGLEQPRPPEAPQHPQPGATPMPSACRRTVP
jgi:hypothetical protein